MQILRGTPATLELNVYNDGDLTDLDAPPTLIVTDAMGATVTAGSVSHPSVGVYRATLDGQDNLAELTATWSGLLDTVATTFTQKYEIVGSLLFIEDEARTAQTSGGQTPLSDDTAYPDAAIIKARDLITEQFELRTGRSWISRYARVEVHGNGSKVVSLSRAIPRDSVGNRVAGPGWFRDVIRVISASLNGATVDVNDLILDRHQIFYTTGTWTQATLTNPLNVVFEIEYGHEWVPAEANEHGLRTAIATLVKGDVSSWAETVTTPEGTERFPVGGIVFPAPVMEWFKQNQPSLVGTGRWGIA